MAMFFAAAGVESMVNDQPFSHGFSWTSLTGPGALAIAMGIGLRYMALQNVKALKDMTDAKDKHIESLERDKIRLVTRCEFYENYIMKRNENIIECPIKPEQRFDQRP